MTELEDRVRHLEMELKRMAQPPRTYSYPVFVDRADRSLVKLEARPQLVPLTTHLASTDWDGDARSTTAKTKIDLSAVFGVPAGIKAVLFQGAIRDSGSAAGDAYLLLSPNDTAGWGAVTARVQGLPNDSYLNFQGVCPCNADGDVYYQILATGVGTLDAYLQIWGYWL